MRHHRAPRLATWLLGLFLPRSDREAVLGDLVEEYAIRARSASAVSATRWYWVQVGRSILPVMWVAVRRGAWLSTVGVAIGAYVASGMIQSAGMAAIVGLFRPDTRLVPVFGAIVGLATIVASGYFAAAIRARAATALACIVLVGFAILTVTQGGAAPLWYRLTVLIVGPLAALTGGALYTARRTGRAMP